jgi:ribosomal RNA assembly protein
MEEDVKFSESDFKHEFIEVSSEVVTYPRYREKYIEQTQKHIKKALEKKKISCAVNLEEQSIEVSTNRTTRDPSIFLKAIDFVRLIARGVQVEEAMKVLEDEYCSEIIEIKSMVKNRERFERRRDRLIGPGSQTLKAIEMLTKCCVLVHGKTVSIIGDYRGVAEVKDIVLKCMNNIHPVYEIKRLIEKRKLGQDETKKNEDWERFLPKVRKTSKRAKKIIKHRRGGMPDEIPKRKEDIEMETGEYFINAENKVKEKSDARKRCREERERRRRTEEDKYTVPDE